MIYEFKRRRVLQAGLAFLAAGIVGAHVAFDLFAIPPDLWVAKALLLIPAVALACFIPGIFIDTFAPGPILKISTEGLRYLPFSRETVPWSSVRNVTLTRGYAHQRGSNEYYRFKLGDGVSFAVEDPKRFPAPPGSVRANTVPISIMPISVQASPQAIIDAVRACWPDGDIREIDAAPPGVTLH